MPFAGEVDFFAVLEREEKAINARRKRITERQSQVAPVDKTVTFSKSLSKTDERGEATPVVKSDHSLVGLALSGGGIRSAAYCLGVLQGLDAVVPEGKPQILDSVDYLSTVSGGGYMGISFAAAMSKGGGRFPFESKLDQAETVETQHLRDYSNYLFPGGGSDVIAGLVMLARGLLINAIILLSMIFFAASLTISIYPTDEALGRSYLLPFLGLPFGTAIVLWLAFGSGQVVYAIIGYWPRSSKHTSLAQREGFSFLFSSLCFILLAVTAMELQAYILRGVIDAVKMRQDLISESAGSLGSFLYDHVFKYNSPWVFLTVAVAAFGTFGSKLLKVVQATIGDKTWSGFLMHWGSRIAIYIGALLVPLALWTIYLYWCYLAIEWTQPLEALCHPNEKAAICSFDPPAPEWLHSFSRMAGNYAAAYFIIFAFLGIASVLVSPNANSLHNYFRDRLSRAFLWSRARLEKDVEDRLKHPAPILEKLARMASPLDERATDEMKLSHLRNVDIAPATLPPGAKSTDDESSDRPSNVFSRMRAALGIKKISSTRNSPRESNGDAPYLLINTSVNLEASKYLNRRGRNADSFFFSPLYVGSEATGYVDTETLEESDANIDLATAMAISGAAASANMGASTIRPLTFSLAVLNVRLGYWLPNPRQIGRLTSWWQQRMARVGPIYFAKEVLGMLDEWTKNVYLTDGGHFDNLGIYQLLKRRCKVIIAVDAEADAPMNFDSLIRLQRYARIDLGIRLDLPWEDLRRFSHKITVEDPHGPNDDVLECVGPHIAVGKIEYGTDEAGVLIYIKACMSGDENDMIRDYRRRNSSFPHETTLDQFFSEEQFEVYRALGFHATQSFFTGRDRYALRPAKVEEGWSSQVENALARINVPPDALLGIVARQRSYESI